MPVLAPVTSVSVRAIPSRESQTRIFVPLQCYFELALINSNTLIFQRCFQFSPRNFTVLMSTTFFFLHLGGKHQLLHHQQSHPLTRVKLQMIFSKTFRRCLQPQTCSGLHFALGVGHLRVFLSIYFTYHECVCGFGIESAKAFTFILIHLFSSPFLCLPSFEPSNLKRRCANLIPFLLPV